MGFLDMVVGNQSRERITDFTLCKKKKNLKKKRNHSIISTKNSNGNSQVTDKGSSGRPWLPKFWKDMTFSIPFKNYGSLNKSTF